MTTVVHMSPALRSVVNDVEDAFERIATGRRPERVCLNCQHCKVKPASPEDVYGIPWTDCARGHWREEMKLPFVVRGRAKDLHQSAQCNDFEASA